jgi:hypothetical protein
VGPETWFFFKKKNVLQITTSAISLKRRELPEKSWEKKKQPTTMATKAKKSQRLFLGGFLAEQRVQVRRLSTQDAPIYFFS